VVKLTFSNPISSMSVTYPIHLLVPAANTSFTTEVTSTPFNRTTSFTVNFGSVGSDVCYVVDFKDGNLGKLLIVQR